MNSSAELHETPDSLLLSGVFTAMREALLPGSAEGVEDKLVEAYDHHMLFPGKCMRSKTCLQASRALGLPEYSAVHLAASVEALHNASLIMDDYQDGALKRRGQPTVVALYGRDIALSLTLRLTTASLVCLTKSGFTSALPVLINTAHQAITETALGQNRDMDAARTWTTEDLKTTAQMKSGPLFGLALAYPLIAAGHTKTVSVANGIGRLLGLGYQILDDIKDRQKDRLQATDSNIVNSLEATHGTEHAVEIALQAARGYLTQTKELAATLPEDSGSGVITLVEKLEQSQM